MRQHRKDLARLPRVPAPNDPGRPRAHVRDTEKAAQEFANLLEKQTRDSSWYVEKTEIPDSIGPLGPIPIRLGRRSDGLVFALHPLSRSMIKEAFPRARPSMTNAFVDTRTWHDFLNMQGSRGDLVGGMAPALTGLTSEQRIDVGYAVVAPVQA